MRHARHLIVQHFAGELDGERRRELGAHLGRCESCRAAYDELALLLRVAADREPTLAEERRWRDALMARIDDAERGAVARPRPRLLQLARSWLAPAAALLVLAGVSALLSAILPGAPGRRGPNVQQRGADGAAAPLLDLELFAVQPATDDAPARVRRLRQGDPVRRDGFLQLRYVSNDPELRHLYVTAVDHRLEPLDYYPRPERQASVSVGEAPAPRSVGRSIRLDRRHNAGPLLVIGLFSDRALTRDEVHSRLRRLLLSGADPDNWGRMPFGPRVHPVVQRVLVVD